MPSSEDPAVQNAYQLECEKWQLSAFIHGLRPNILTEVQLQAPKTMERATEIANTVYLSFKSKNDTDDADIYFTSSRARDWRCMSYGHRFTGFMPSSLRGFHRGHRQPPHNRAVVSRPRPWRAHIDQGQYQACSKAAKYLGAAYHRRRSQPY
jgi:hypothetical protein